MPKGQNSTPTSTSEVKDELSPEITAKPPANNQEIKDLAPLFEVYQPKFVWATPDESEPKKMTVQEFCTLTAQLQAQELKEKSPNAEPPKVKPWLEGVYYRKTDEKQIAKLKNSQEKRTSRVEKDFIIPGVGKVFVSGFRPDDRRRVSDQQIVESYKFIVHPAKIKEGPFTIHDVNRGIQFSEENIFRRWKKGFGWISYLFAGKTFPIEETPILVQTILDFNEYNLEKHDTGLFSAGAAICFADTSQFASCTDSLNHGPNQESLRNYQFTSPDLKSKVQPANLESMLITVVDQQGTYWHVPSIIPMHYDYNMQRPSNNSQMLLYDWGYGNGNYWNPVVKDEPILFDTAHNMMDPNSYYYQFMRGVEIQFTLDQKPYGSIILSYNFSDIQNSQNGPNEIFYQTHYTISKNDSKMDGRVFDIVAKFEDFYLAQTNLYTGQTNDIIISVAAKMRDLPEAQAEQKSKPPSIDAKAQPVLEENGNKIREAFQNIIANCQLPNSTVKYYPQKDIVVFFCEDNLENTVKRDNLFNRLQALVPDQKDLIKKGYTPHPNRRLQIQVEKPRILLDKMQELIINKLNAFTGIKEGWQYNLEIDDAYIRAINPNKEVKGHARELYKQLLKLRPDEGMLRLHEIVDDQVDIPSIEIHLHQPWLFIITNEKVFNALLQKDTPAELPEPAKSQQDLLPTLSP